MDKDFDKKIEKLLYFKKGILTVEKYMQITASENITSVKYENDDFIIKTNTDMEFRFKVLKK